MKKLWLIFIAIFIASFAVLGWVGTEIFRQAPPIPKEVVTTEGTVLLSGDDIQNGQNVWQAMGGMEMGSIWGHGSYVAPDWTADYLHTESIMILDQWSQKDFASSYNNITSEQQAMLRQRLQDTIRKNTYDTTTGRLTIDPVRAQVFEANLQR
jgi:nitric oxide reductase subunit B